MLMHNLSLAVIAKEQGDCGNLMGHQQILDRLPRFARNDGIYYTVDIASSCSLSTISEYVGHVSLSD